MTSLTISPSIDQAALQNFNDSFHELAQQTQSKLVASKAVTFMSSKGKTNNYARIGRLELSEVNTRNPDKQYGDYALDNRQFTKRRFTKTIQIDAKYDINELIKDPSSDILKQLNNAKERVTDRIAIAAAVGPVLTGGPDQTPVSTSATADGVITVSATGGFVFGTVQSVTQNFINNDVPYSQFSGTVLCITGKENTNLMGEEKFTSQFYIPGHAVVDNTVQTKVGGYRVELFAGSVLGGAQVPNPILPEGTTTRSCVALAPGSIVMAMELADMSVTKSAIKVNSWDITIDFWINAMRTEGALVQIITTTI
jgi:hypothetical protein